MEMERRTPSNASIAANAATPDPLAWWPCCAGPGPAEAALGARPTTACTWDERVPGLGDGDKRGGLGKGSIKWRLQFNECTPVCTSDKLDFQDKMADIEHRGWDAWAEVPLPGPARFVHNEARKASDPGTPKAARGDLRDEWAEEVLPSDRLSPSGLRPKMLDQVSGSLKLRGGVSRSRIKGVPSRGLKQIDLLTNRMLKKSVGHANSAAISEAPASSPVAVRLAEEPVDEPVMSCSGQAGSCGFTVTIRRTQVMADGRDLGMCHHYTWDGKHCVGAGLRSEHANRCAGRLYFGGAVADLHLCKTPLRCTCSASRTAEAVGAPQACSKLGDNDLIEVVCGPPARRGHAGRAISSCTEIACPFLAEGTCCPYADGLQAIGIREATSADDWHGHQASPLPPALVSKWASPESLSYTGRKKDSVFHL